MHPLNEPTKREFALRMLNILTSCGDAVKAEGVDATERTAMLKALVDAAFAAEDAQIRMTAEARKASALSRSCADEAYAAASGMLDLVAGTIGKDSALTRRLRKLRKELSRDPAKTAPLDGSSVDTKIA
ncbi:MAG: hypothetical protein HZC28_08360 [Spirochaetes bacterium]|nr:hypothetical protein [Spirochaetota bacterium]